MIKFYLKTFLKEYLIKGIPIGLLMIIWDIFINENQPTINHSIWKFLFLSFFFGIVMTIESVIKSKKNKE